MAKDTGACTFGRQSQKLAGKDLCWNYYEVWLHNLGIGRQMLRMLECETQESVMHGTDKGSSCKVLKL